MGYIRFNTNTSDGKKTKPQQIITRRRERTHMTIVIEAEQDDFDSLRKEIAHTIRKHNRASERKVSYAMIRTLPTNE